MNLLNGLKVNPLNAFYSFSITHLLNESTQNIFVTLIKISKNLSFRKRVVPDGPNVEKY